MPIQKLRTTRRIRMAAPARAAVKPDEELATLAWGLAHPARVAILRLLYARGGCLCGDVVSRMPLAQATVSQHLKALKETGWIEGEIDGPRVCYCPTAGAAERFEQLIQDLRPGERRKES